MKVSAANLKHEASPDGLLRWLLVLLLLPTAGALLSDPAGDVKAGSATIPFDGADLLFLHATESADAVTFWLGNGIIETADPRIDWHIQLATGGQAFRLDVTAPAGLPRQAYADIQRIDEGVAGARFDLEMVPIHDNGTIEIRVGRSVLLGQGGAPPGPGEVLAVGPVTAWVGAADGPGDIMPDDGQASKMTWQLGATSLGNLVVTATPLGHFSNGESTIHAFVARIHNQGDAEEVTLTTQAPDGYDHATQFQAVRLNQGESATVKVWVSSPFAHQHGTDADISLKLAAAGQTALMPLRLHYPLVPQPTGHHNTMWFHALPPDEQETNVAGAEVAFWSTLEEDPRGTAQPVPAHRGGGYVQGNGKVLVNIWEWDLRLSPGLLLDLDPAGPGAGSLDFEFQTDVPLLNTSVEMSVLYRDRASEINDRQQTREVFRAELVELGDLTPGAYSASTTVHAVEPKTLVPATDGFSLWIDLQIRNDPWPLLTPTAPPPVVSLLPGASLQLPLREVSFAPATMPSAPFLELATPEVGADATVWVPIAAPAGTSYALRAFGPHQGLLEVPAQWHAHEAVGEIPVTLRVPPSLPNGTRILAAVLAVPDNPTLPTGYWPLDARFNASIEPELEVRSDVPPASPDEASPWPLWPILVALFMARRAQASTSTSSQPAGMKKSAASR